MTTDCFPSGTPGVDSEITSSIHGEVTLCCMCLVSTYLRQATNNFVYIAWLILSCLLPYAHINKLDVWRHSQGGVKQHASDSLPHPLNSDGRLESSLLKSRSNQQKTTTSGSLLMFLAGLKRDQARVIRDYQF